MICRAQTMLKENKENGMKPADTVADSAAVEPSNSKDHGSNVQEQHGSPNESPPGDDLVPRPRLQCQELCRIECSKRWSFLKACFDIHWGCLIGCASACSKDTNDSKCRAKCDDSFDHRCDSLGCTQGCELGASNEIKFVPKEFLSKSGDATTEDDGDVDVAEND